MWMSSTRVSGSPFRRQAASVAPSCPGGHTIAALDTGIGGLRKNRGVGVFITRLRAPRARTR